MTYEIKAIVNVTGVHCVNPDGEDCQFIMHFDDPEEGCLTECGLFIENIDDPDEERTYFVKPALRCKTCLNAEEEFKKKGLQELG